MKKTILIINLFFLFSFLFLSLEPMECSAIEQGFFIRKNKDKQLTIESIPITIFSTKDKLIYPGSQGSGNFVIKNSDKKTVSYELLITNFSEGALPIIYRLNSDDKEWYMTSSETKQVLSIKGTLLPYKKVEYVLSWKWTSDEQQDQHIQELATSKNMIENICLQLKVEDSEDIVVDADDKKKNTNYSMPIETNNLPQTGEIKKKFLAMICFLIVLFLLLWVIKKRKNYEVY